MNLFNNFVSFRELFIDVDTLLKINHKCNIIYCDINIPVASKWLLKVVMLDVPSAA